MVLGIQLVEKSLLAALAHISPLFFLVREVVQLLCLLLLTKLRRQLVKSLLELGYATLFGCQLLGIPEHTLLLVEVALIQIDDLFVPLLEVGLP